MLAREIHEAEDARPTPSPPSPPAVQPEAVLARADENGVGPVVRTLYAAALDVGFYARPWAKSLMFAPPRNRTRCLFVVWVERRYRTPGQAKAYIAAEAFEQFYGIKETDLVAAVGPVGYVVLDPAGAGRVAEGLRRIMAAKVGD